ncbi:MAG: hypothetical protein WC558_14805, partial [Patulibacter sp.]
RLAALCATGDERTYLARRLARLALQEQEVIAGSRRIDRELPEQVDELADCLRAVLRDSVCGHLSGDLVEIAEEILDGLADEPVSPRDAWREEQVERERRRRADAAVLDANAADDDLGIARRGSGRGVRDRDRAPGIDGDDVRELDLEIEAERLPPAIEPFDPVGVIDAARISKLAPDDVWLDQTWIEPQVHEPTVQPDDDATGPWPTAG